MRPECSIVYSTAARSVDSADGLEYLEQWVRRFESCSGVECTRMHSCVVSAVLGG